MDYVNIKKEELAKGTQQRHDSCRAVVCLRFEKSINAYLQQFNETEKKAYLIAKSHLGTSFNIARSNGYIEWKKKQEKT